MRDPARDVCCVSATQVGKTFAYACKLLAAMWEYRGRNPWWWCAPTYKQSVPGQRLMYELASSAGIMKSGPKPPFSTNPPPPINLINGVACEYRTWDDPANLMGTTIAGVVVDEAGILTPTAHSAISTRRSETLGPMWMIGNPGLVAGPFRRLCSRAESGAEDMSFHRWTWRDKLGALTGKRRVEYERFIEQERQALPDYEFRRLYDAEWTEDEAAVFRNVHELTVGHPVLEPDGHARVFGIDVAQQTDYLVACGIREDVQRVDHMVRFRGVGYPQAAERLKSLQSQWNAQFVVEVNGPGVALVQEFDRIGVHYMPFTTTAASKQDVILGLAADFQERRIELADMPPLQYELSIFRYERLPSGHYRYQAPPGEHDDTVMALALARWGKPRLSSGGYGWVA